MHQAGLPIAVATLGTATTAEHVEMLFRAAPDVVFCFDGDRAGRAAAWKALEASLPRLRDGRQAFFMFLPEGEDPDTLIRQEGKQAFEKRLEHATVLSEYFFTELDRDVDTRTLDGRARLAERARPLIAKLPDGAFRDLMLDELERRSGARLPSQIQVPLSSGMMRAGGRKPSSLVRRAISLLLSQPTLATEVTKPYCFLSLEKPGVALLAALLDIASDRPGINPVMLVEHFTDKPEYAALKKLLTYELVGDPGKQREEFHDALKRMQHLALELRCRVLQAKMSQHGLNDMEKQELREGLAMQRERRHTIIST